MKLKDHLSQTGQTHAGFGQRIGKGAGTVQRYCLPSDHPRYRVPNSHTMVLIYVTTNGAVQPNDFYDLPPLATVDPGVQELDGAGDRVLDGGGQEGPVDEQAAQDLGALGVGASARDGDRGLGGHGAKSATAGEGGQAP